MNTIKFLHNLFKGTSFEIKLNGLSGEDIYLVSTRLKYYELIPPKKLGKLLATRRISSNERK